MTETLSNWSNIVIYIAIAVYSVAFLLFTLDFAGRGSREAKAAQQSSALGATARVRERELVGAGAPAAEAADADAAGAGISVARAAEGGSGAGVSSAAATETRWRDRSSTKLLPIAMAVTVVGWVLHLAATVLRGVAAERVPWANMYEFWLTATLLIVLVFLLLQLWQDLRFLGAFITGFATLSLGIATIGFYVGVVPLQPALQSIWLVIHVFVASVSTGFLALGCALSVLQLLQQRREARVRAGESVRGPLGMLPSSERLEDMSFRMNVIGFILWTFTLVAGAVWAERAWGRYWGWDTKEVWTFIIWVVYAGYLHARTTKGWRGSPSAWLSIVGFATVLFNFGVVNVFFKGLHAYSGL
ncbi:MAG: c-type cytochrome biogenesis protein CcsB [Microbacteriaceae bacterium]|nr:c-type cytochrome biogenesis protein CcsB [Microbacteriaceae bacterium]